MTLSRRAFTFASLAATFAKVARAESPGYAQAPNPPPQQIPELEEPVVEPTPDQPFHATARLVEVSRGVLELHVELKNRGGKTSVMVARGSRPAGDPAITVNVAGVPTELERVQTDADRREFMSRMGPVPRFADVKGNESFVLGPWRFALPAEAVGPAQIRLMILHGKDSQMQDSLVGIANVGWARAAS